LKEARRLKIARISDIISANIFFEIFLHTSTSYAYNEFSIGQMFSKKQIPSFPPFFLKPYERKSDIATRLSKFNPFSGSQSMHARPFFMA
jgi:hypothetical protein